MLKKLPIFIVALLLSVLVLSQIPSVRAQVLPLTAPVTPPVTTPVTSPAPDFNLTGTFVYKQLGRLFSNMQRIVPVEGAVVTAQNFFNPAEEYTTTTDSDGEYGFEIPNGFYKVSVADEDAAIVAPPIRVVNIRNNEKTADFQGLLFPHFGL